LQFRWVRASTCCYARFTLTMDSSRGFGSTPSDSSPPKWGAPSSDSLSLRLHNLSLLNLPERCNSPVHSSIGTPSNDQSSFDCLSTCGFSSLSLPSRGAFHLSLTVLVHYRSPSVFSLGGWSPQLPTGFLVSRGTHVLIHGAIALSPTGLSPSLATRSSNVLLALMVSDSATPRPGAQ
jgi:hypothetical protein